MPVGWIAGHAAANYDPMRPAVETVIPRIRESARLFGIEGAKRGWKKAYTLSQVPCMYGWRDAARAGYEEWESHARRAIPA